jgi:hypothetical protein
MWLWLGSPWLLLRQGWSKGECVLRKLKFVVDTDFPLFLKLNVDYHAAIFRRRSSSLAAKVSTGKVG